MADNIINISWAFARMLCVHKSAACRCFFFYSCLTNTTYCSRAMTKRKKALIISLQSSRLTLILLEAIVESYFSLVMVRYLEK